MLIQRQHRSPSDTARLAGLRRLELVLISVYAGAVSCQVRGVGHRLPMMYPISLSTALQLQAGGVPTRIDQRRTPARRT